MKIKLQYGETVLFDKDGTLLPRDISRLQERLNFLAATPEQRTVLIAQAKTEWLAKLPEEKRIELLALEALPPDEQKLEYAKLQQAALQTQLAKVEADVATMTVAVSAKPVLGAPIKLPVIKP